MIAVWVLVGMLCQAIATSIYYYYFRDNLDVATQQAIWAVLQAVILLFITPILARLK